MTTIVRWSPWRELERAVAEQHHAHSATTAFTPDLDVIERGEQLLVRVDLPGMQRDDLTVEVYQGRLTISGERRADESRDGDRYWHFERRVGSFRRMITLPRGVGDEAVAASYQDGVLEIAIALPRRLQPKTVTIA
jgi:HSP20 family protein